MKVGILTFHWVYNYGANLQTLSSVHYFKKAGHNPVVINWVPEDLEQYYLNTTSKEQVAMFKAFQEANYPLTRLCRNAKDVASVIQDEKIDLVFIGADTVFKLRKPGFSLRKLKMYYPNSEGVFPNPFWGEFLNYGVDVPVVGFSIASNDSSAAKFKKEAPEIYRYLQRFKSLTVRDVPTQEMVRDLSFGNIVPEITPDPVFAFNDNVDLNELESKVLGELGITPMSYYLICETEPFNEKISGWAKELASLIEKDGSELIELPRQTGNKCFDVKQLKKTNLNPLEWYVVIKNSKGYVGGLMHPLICCIHNKVPFYSIDYYGIKRYRFFTDYKSSKAYQLIKEGNLLKYYYSLHSRENIPSPSDVYDKLKNYDFEALAEFSDKMKVKLLSAMERTIDKVK